MLEFRSLVSLMEKQESLQTDGCHTFSSIYHEDDASTRNEAREIQSQSRAAETLRTPAIVSRIHRRALSTFIRIRVLVVRN